MTISTRLTYGAVREGAPAAEALVRFVTEAELQSGADLIAPAFDEAIRKRGAQGLFQGKAGQTETLPTLGLYESPHIVFVGCEPGSGAQGLRLAGAAAAKALKAIRASDAAIELPADIWASDIAELGAERAAQALTEGLLLALHDRLPLKREPAERFALREVRFVPQPGEAVPGAAGAAPGVGDARRSSAAEAWQSGAARGLIMAESVAYARDLTNLPGNDLTPERLAFHAEELAHELELDIEVIDEWTADEQGMGGLLGVGQGSVNPPRMIVLHYKGAPDSEQTWGWIGKGITFDTGGISLKRAPGMEEMISDMGGAAAVLGALRAAAMLKAEANIVAVIPAAENMPSDRALKPGDVIRTMSGYTVEVVNTDAEGRLVLADGLTTAIRRGATRLVDVATLTGAVMVTLGYEATGAVTNDEGLMSLVLAASKRSGERVWELPAYPEFKKGLQSDAADLKNSGSRYGAASAGGLFIGHFAEGLPWVHLDIGGSAWLESARSLEPKGATGVMVRTLAELVVAQ